MKTIVVGLDQSEQAPSVLREAVALANATDAGLSILHAVELPPTLPSNLWGTSADQILAQYLEEARARIDELVLAVPADRLAGTTIRVGLPWREICNEAIDKNAEMIVIGAHCHGLIDRMLGTTAASVVNHADRTVTVVRPPRATGVE